MSQVKFAAEPASVYSRPIMDRGGGQMWAWM